MNLQLPERLKARLAEPLPGRTAQQQFAPELSFGRQFGPAPDSARHAAVILLLYPLAGQWHLPLTLRPAQMAAHAGQISFPGGMIERGESSGEAALRELYEELGAREGVRMLGRLSEFYVFVSNNRVTPWVGVIDQRPTWHPNPEEVAAVLEVPLTHLLDPANTSKFVVERGELQFEAPCFVWQDQKIWGATSMILNELVELVRDIGVE